MKLDNKRNILIYQKAAYAEQLVYYTKMCEIYSELSKMPHNFKIASDVENYYSKALSLACSENFNVSSLDPKFSKEEIELIKLYSIYAFEFNNFKTLINDISEVLNNG